MLWAKLLWIVIGLGLVVYALTGGADLGSGLWSLLASGPRARAQRDAVHKAIAPIWEANHVWLIFIIVVMFSAFSRAFALIAIALHIPIALALLGMVFRGSAYVFHAYGIQGHGARAGWERVFGWASVLTPICLGLVVGGVSSGRIRVQDGRVTTGFLAGWPTLFAISVGLFALALFAMLAAVYLAAETQGELRNDFRRRALAMEGVAAALAASALGLAWRDAPEIFSGLLRSSFALPVQLLTALLAAATIFLLYKRRIESARFTAAAQVAMVVVGWGLSMREHFILPDVPLAQASSNQAVMPALAIALGAGAIVLIPALFYLYRVFKSE